MKLAGYIRVSTQRQATEGYSLTAQTDELHRWAGRHEHAVVAVLPEVMSGAKTARLHAREAAVRLIEMGVAQGLLVLRFDRATRSMLDGQELLERSRRGGWPILTTDGKDSTNPQHFLMTDVEMAFAAHERRRISERTKEGLAVARASGKQLGRPSTIPDNVRAFILERHDAGQSSRSIASELTALSIPTPGGSTAWPHSTVTRALRRWAA